MSVEWDVAPWLVQHFFPYLRLAGVEQMAWVHASSMRGHNLARIHLEPPLSRGKGGLIRRFGRCRVLAAEHPTRVWQRLRAAAAPSRSRLEAAEGYAGFREGSRGN